MDLVLLGSQTAKNGFKNENDIVRKFNNWKRDTEAKKWLLIMEYRLADIEYVRAVKVHGEKTDVQVQVTIKLKKAIDVQNLQIKLVSNLKGFNQIDKRWIDKYKVLWNIPKTIVSILKRYTGQVVHSIPDTRETRRLFANELTKIEQRKVLAWLKNNKSMIVSDVLKGRSTFAAEWMLVAQKCKENSGWILRPMNYCLNYFGNGDITITKRGTFKIGLITMQRKGGDGGRPSACMLQFKINPTLLFENEETKSQLEDDV